MIPKMILPRNLHKPCNILIALNACCSVLAMCNPWITFGFIMSAKNFIPLGICVYFHLIPVAASVYQFFFYLLISIERTIAVLFPIWYEKYQIKLDIYLEKPNSSTLDSFISTLIHLSQSSDCTFLNFSDSEFPTKVNHLGAIHLANMGPNCLKAKSNRSTQLFGRSTTFAESFNIFLIHPQHGQNQKFFRKFFTHVLFMFG